MRLSRTCSHERVVMVGEINHKGKKKKKDIVKRSKMGGRKDSERGLLVGGDGVWGGVR